MKPEDLERRNLFISFSGGETSALMALLLMRSEYRHLFNDVFIGFANTAEENEETLQFIRNCETHYGLDISWVEAVVNPQKGAGTTHRDVNFYTASRRGEPYEAMVRKFGLPNTSRPHCTRELKLRPLYSKLASIGWAPGSYYVAIGIRADEAHRRSKSARRDNIIYPFLDFSPLSKADVNTFWREQPFRLQLAGYEGNCRWCFKKSLRKLLTIMEFSPERFDFPARMEREYGRVGPEFEKGVARSYRRTFFRNNLSTEDLRALHSSGRVDPAEDDSIIFNGTPINLDLERSDGACTESCEVDWSSVSTATGGVFD